jgi:hypothetical protein
MGGVVVSGADGDIIVQTQAPQQGTQAKLFLNTCTPQNTLQISVIDHVILEMTKQQCKQALHVVTRWNGFHQMSID